MKKLVTGIVNLKSTVSYTTSQNNTAILYTHDKQSENNDFLGMAISVDKKYNPVFGETSRTGTGITNTYTATLDIKNGQPVVFRFYGCWEQTNKMFANRNAFERFLKQEAVKGIRTRTPTNTNKSK